MPPKITVGTHFHARLAIKSNPVFLPIDEEAPWVLLPSSFYLLSSGIVQPETTCFCILKVADQV